MNQSNPAMISRAAAKVQGLKKFFTGDPCRNEHIGERYVTTGQCVECCKGRAVRSKQRKQGVKIVKHAAILKVISRADAQTQGLTKYYANEVCEFGHQAERYTRDGGCVECRRIRNKKHHSRNPHHASTTFTAEVYPSAIVPLAPEEQHALANVYRRAAWFTQMSGIKHLVEHCYPLALGGVHHPENLRVSTEAANRAMSNKPAPEDPEVFHGFLVSFPQKAEGLMQKRAQGRKPLMIRQDEER